jgi:hypothetical protein
MKNFWLAKLVLGILTLMIGVLLGLMSQNSTIGMQNRAKIAHFLATPQMVLSCEAKQLRDFLLPEYVSAFQDFPAYHDRFMGSSFFKPIPK